MNESDLAKLKKVQAQADRELFMNQVLGASYVRMEDVKAAHADFVFVIKNRFSQVPESLAPKIAGKEDKREIVKLIRAEIYQAILDLQDIDVEKITSRNEKITRYQQKLDESRPTRPRDGRTSTQKFSGVRV